MNWSDAYTGKATVEYDGDKIEEPQNVVVSARAAKNLYIRLLGQHKKRCLNYARIQGMIDGNPPFNPQALKRAGLSDMCNVNWKDGDAIFQSVALAYWSLFNDVQTIIEFRLNLTDNKGLNTEWGQILAQEWDKVVRSWPNFTKFMTFHQSELLKFGLSALVWPDDRDFRFKPVEVQNFLLPNESRDDLSEISLVAVEHKYSAQYLWSIYQNLRKHNTQYWDKDALGMVLWKGSKLYSDHRSGGFSHDDGLMEIQRSIRNGDTYYDELYNDDIPLISIFAKEYDEKISHVMVHPDIETDEFPYFFDRQYERMHDALVYFTFKPGERYIHGNKGLGHSILSSIQAITHLDCSVLDQAKRAGSLLLRSGATRGRDDRAIKFVHGGVIDIGEAELAQNTMGNNVGQTVEVSRYFQQKVISNNNLAGRDPSQTDRNVQSVRQLQLQATKEARVQKNMITHYYEQLDHLFREMVRKMLHSKKGDPGYEYCSVWKDRVIARGVPKEVFEVKGAVTTPEGLPSFIEVFATRSAGSGSQLADQIEMERMMQIIPTLGERGRMKVLQDYIAAHRGHRYVDRYSPPEDQGQQPVGSDTIASIENNQLSDGKQVTVSPDNNHIVHMVNHMRVLKEIVQAYRENPQAQFDKETTLLQKTDSMLEVMGPHFIQHLMFASQDPTRSEEIAQFNSEWAVISNFADQISVNAGRQREAELRKVQEQEQELQRQAEQNTPEHIRARGDIELKRQKLEAQIQRDRTRDQHKFALAGEQLRNRERLESAKVQGELSREAKRLQMEAIREYENQERSVFGRQQET